MADRDTPWEFGVSLGLKSDEKYYSEIKIRKLENYGILT